MGHLLNQPAGARIANLQPPLEQTHAAAAALNDQVHGLVEERIALGVSPPAAGPQPLKFVVKLRLSLLRQVIDQVPQFILLDVSSLGTDKLR